MPNNSVALVLTFTEASALFEAGNLGLHRKEELGMSINERAVDALVKIARGMGFMPEVQGNTVYLVPPMDEKH